MFKISAPAWRPWALIALLFTSASRPAMASLFTPPDAPFILRHDEQVVAVPLAAGPVSAAQASLAAARAANPDAVLVARLNGSLEVEDAPLQLGSRTCLILGPDARITLSPHSTALPQPATLVQIRDAENVAISSAGPDHGILDGGGQAVDGITVYHCGRLHFDALTIRHCQAALVYTGRNPEAVNDACSLTRSQIAHCQIGLDVLNTAGFMCLENTFQANANWAVALHSAHGVVAGNEFRENGAGIISGSAFGLVARNQFTGGRISLLLRPESRGNLVTDNTCRGDNGQCVLAGTNNLLYGNHWGTCMATNLGGTNNLCLEASPAPAGLTQFNPPTFAHPHDNPAIVPGLGRYDLTLAGATNRYEPADLAPVQTALQAARSDHPNDVLVLHLQGHFLSRSPEGMTVPPNTCVILEGSLRGDLGAALDPVYDRAAPLSQLVHLPDSGYAAFSGGFLDGGRQVFIGINATNPGTALIEGVNIKSCVREGIHTKGRGNHAPLVVSDCTISANGGRGLWIHVASQVYALGNTCVANQSDGIDLDAGAHNCFAVFNTSGGNRRHGVFVEEAVSGNLVLGNQLTGNQASGVHVWNQAVPGNTGGNVVAANRCQANRKGISVGGRAADRTANDNLFFNNPCQDNCELDWSPGNAHAPGNYFAQSVLGESTAKKAAPVKAGAYFFSLPGQ